MKFFAIMTYIVCVLFGAVTGLVFLLAGTGFLSLLCIFLVTASVFGAIKIAEIE